MCRFVTYQKVREDIGAMRVSFLKGVRHMAQGIR